MHVEQLTVPYSSENDTWRLSGIGDMHVGNAGFQEKEFLAARKAVLDQGINVILMGDLADCIGVRDKRADLESVDPRYYGSLSRYVDASLDHLKELLEPMRGSVLGVVRVKPLGTMETRWAYLDGEILTEREYNVRTAHTVTSYYRIDDPSMNTNGGNTTEPTPTSQRYVVDREYVSALLEMLIRNGMMPKR